MTCCPSCKTAFRVRPEQLTQAQAWLRCGHCQRVFDSTGLVVDWPELEQVPTHEEAVSSESSFVAGTLKYENLLQSHEPHRATALWLAVVALLCALPLLMLWPQRQAVVSRWPVLWTGMHVACQAVHCEMPALLRPQDVVIDNAALTPEGEAYVLTAVLRNAAAWPVQMAALELTLLDAQEQAVFRRVLMPAELNLPAVLQPEQTTPMRLVFALPSLTTAAVTGYRLRSVQP